VWRFVLTTGTGSIFGFLVARQAYDAAIMAPMFIAMSLAFGQAARDAGILESVNPATGAPIGRVYASSAADYERLMERAEAAFKVWRTIPAPRRGEAVRLCGEALRRHKDALGSLVTLEMGKIKAEGDGEVQEMIDIADFAVGQSRMLYGLSMHSERPGHRMFEQWHPLGLVGIISAFNFPVAVWAWNSMLAAICGDISIWKPSPKTTLSAVAATRICNDALRAGGFPDIFFLFNDAGTEIAQRFVDDRRVAGGVGLQIGGIDRACDVSSGQAFRPCVGSLFEYVPRPRRRALAGLSDDVGV